MESPTQFKGRARLPDFAIPKRYDLTLKPDLAACSFSGTVRIVLDVLRPSRFLVLNSLDLAIAPGSVTFSSGDQRLIPGVVVLEEDDEILVIDFDDTLRSGTGVLEIGFSGVLNDHMKGFYRSTCIIDGVKQNMAVTQFEAVEARRCFPCWDEPALKATFKITVEVPCELTVLSNMPVAKETFYGSVKNVYFEESPTMSTYLVAVIVGMFDYIEDLTSDGIKVRAYCPIGKSDQGKFGLNVAVRSLELYKEYFSVPYALPKLDLVVIPDFYGAMENYGVITFCDTALLYDEHFSAAANKQWIATVVTHEVAHQWFGNLVTMEWWTHLWLNEGFATWVSYLAADAFFPEWNIWALFLQQTTGGLKLDSLTESHPIEVDVAHARAVDEIFDAISYKKGSSIIRMLEAYLGCAIFQKSLAAYIKRYACKNAKTDELWEVLSAESGISVKMMMESWTKQKGYPVIHVKFNNGFLEFRQSHFSLTGSVEDAYWIVPITLFVGSYDKQKKFLLDSKILKLELSELLPLSKQNDSQTVLIKVNVEQTGFYRVKYDETISALLREGIKCGSLSAVDRYGVLDDSFALCMAGQLPLSSLLSWMDVYKHELDYIVLSRLITVILQVLKLTSCSISNSFNKLKQYFISLLEVSAQNLGWEQKSNEDHQTAMLRGEVLTALAILNHEITSKEAIRRFNIFLEDKNTTLLPPDTRKATYTAVMRSANTGDKHGLESLLKLYRETDVAQEKERILSALASSPDPDIVDEALNFLLSSEIRDQDIIYGLRGISLEGSETAWRWLKDNWEIIMDRWGHNYLLTHFIRDIVIPSYSEVRVDEMEEFFLVHTKPSIAMTVKQSLEQARINAKWAMNVAKEENLEELITELAEKNSKEHVLVQN
ncbi:Peptidase M1 alanine aminopeptidase/leukotriene A4 hydrolase protein [Dioscorea alata]|uniref:Peptidase M1 alanine aminopeptidase/leukotriene A4 hydrolase protein n=1 Tax=Dioscorea alata TaxID=55571 RepID=A0ACB7TZK7_DIOAL|nr:Peptidase M1 alanine aminopeptidase/leukotriene A4 hydrolase protein [Dioscorea alata]